MPPDETRAIAVVKLVSEGRISIGKAAESLDLSIYDLHAIIQEYGVQVGPTQEQLRQSNETLKRILAEEKAESST